MRDNIDTERHAQHHANKARIVLWGFVAIALYFLLTEHRAHTIAALPWLLILACPLMHLFLHRHHDHAFTRLEAEIEEHKHER